MTTPQISFSQQMNAKIGDTRPSTIPSPTTPSPYVSGGGYHVTKAPDTLIEVMEGDQLYGTFTLPNNYSEWFPLARRHYPQGSTLFSVAIPKDRCRFDYATPKFNGCTFDATDSYLSARWGRKLHHSDRSWLALHPLASDDGIPTEYTLICLQQLLEPYGMGISAVRMRRGTLAASKHVMQFATALGCNPLGLFDHQTSNAEAAEKFDVTPEKAKQLWRFEFADEPLPGCTIVCERGVTSQAGSNGFTTGYAGGHARYLAPRDRFGNWVLSLQFAPLETISYDTPVILPEYVERKGEATLDLGGVLQPDSDKKVAVKVNGWYKDPDEAAAAEEERTRTGVTFYGYQSDAPTPTTPSTGQGKSDSPTPTPKEPLTQRVLCTLCNLMKPMFSMEKDSTCCIDCYTKAWDKYQCPECKTAFGITNLPELKKRHHDVGFTTFYCPSLDCKCIIQVFDVDQTKDLVAMVKTLDKSHQPSSQK
jgi:hypothetical protein